MGSGSGLKANVHAGGYHVSDNLSRYSLCSNDSNGMRMRCKLLRGMGMHGKLVHENGVCVARPIPTGSRGSEVKTRAVKNRRDVATGERSRIACLGVHCSVP